MPQNVKKLQNAKNTQNSKIIQNIIRTGLLRVQNTRIPIYAVHTEEFNIVAWPRMLMSHVHCCTGGRV